MPKCPVCKTECGDAVVCPECGFEELHPVFLSTEEGNAWVKNVVWPWREQYWKTLSQFEIKHDGRRWRLIECNALESRAENDTINIPYGVEVIGRNAFGSYRCTIDKAIHIPSTVVEIEDEAFCRACRFDIIWSLDIPQSVIRIGKDAFKNRIILTLIIPNSVKYIGSNAFVADEVFCEAESAPDGWASDAWNSESHVYWGGTWHYEHGIPHPN